MQLKLRVNQNTVWSGPLNHDTPGSVTLSLEGEDGQSLLELNMPLANVLTIHDRPKKRYEGRDTPLSGMIDEGAVACQPSTPSPDDLWARVWNNVVPARNTTRPATLTEVAGQQDHAYDALRNAMRQVAQHGQAYGMMGQGEQIQDPILTTAQTARAQAMAQQAEEYRLAHDRERGVQMFERMLRQPRIPRVQPIAGNNIVDLEFHGHPIVPDNHIGMDEGQGPADEY
jgi:hypothetical protein